MDVNEKRYEPETQGFSEEEAQKIELESREVAELIEGNSINEDIPEENTTALPEKEFEKTQSVADDPSIPQMDESQQIALGFIFEKDYSKFTSYCQSKGILPEAMIEEINYFAFLNIEDIVLESDGEEYRVIEDYEKEVKTWLKK